MRLVVEQPGSTDYRARMRRPKPPLTALVLLASLSGPACVTPQRPAYFDTTGRTDLVAGGIRMIEVNLPKGKTRVWTKRVGNNPTIKVLLLHGGPGTTHEYFEAADSYFPGASIEYYYYDQAGSAYSDPVDDVSALLSTQRFVDEVEQVRVALGLGPESFYLLGHSWGGILAIEYALAHQNKLKGLIISNMMSSVPAYNAYAKEVLMPKMNQAALSEILALEAKKDFDNPRYEDLLMSSFYTEHLLRMPADQWPDPVKRTFSHLNKKIYTPMQGPSEMGASGILERWDRSADLKTITVPTLVIGAAHDTMDPRHMEWMAKQLPKGRYLYCAKGSHLALYDDQVTWFSGVIQFLHDVDGRAASAAR
jgi:proline iminopeptidase